MGRSDIEWTDSVWNPVTGCTPVSAGCANCYAARMARRLRGRCGYPSDDPFRVTFHRDRLEQPLHWRKPRTIFVCSMGDLFHGEVKAEQIRQVFDVMRRADWHRFLVLTKRTERMQAMSRLSLRGWPEHVWAGASVGANFLRLHRTEARHKFASYEPLLRHPSWIEPVRGLDWLIIGGESGRGARPMELDWARGLIAQCRGAGVAVFVKQLGAAHGVPGDPKCADPKHWPEDLRVREWPDFALRGTSGKPEGLTDGGGGDHER